VITVIPWDASSHKRATIFCRHFLVGHLDPSLLAKAWVAIDGSRTLGIVGIQSLPEVSVFYATDEQAARAMADRINSYLADRGCRGNYFFLNCGTEFLSAWGRPEPAERNVIEVP
jgi:hypothetical protein